MPSLRWWLALFTLVLPSLAAIPTVSAADSYEDALAVLKAAAKGSDVAATCRAVHALAAIPDKKVDRELLRITSRHREDRVCAEAARALGVRGGKGNLSQLTRLVKAYRKRPRALEGVIDGIGEFRSPRSVDLLFEQARTFMNKHAGVTLAAIRALGAIRTKDAAKRLVETFGLTSPRVGGGAFGSGIDSGPGMMPGMTSDATLEKLSEYRPHIARSLRRLTGQAFEDMGDWQEWWKDARKTFKPPRESGALNLQRKLLSSRYRLEIVRPAGGWKWVEKPEDGFQLTAEKRAGGRRVAWLSIHVHSILREGPVTVAALLDEQKTALKKRLRGIGRAKWDEPFDLSGTPARFQTATGTSKEGLVRLSQAAALKGTRMYLVRWTVTAEAGFDAEEELKEFVGSLRLSN